MKRVVIAALAIAFVISPIGAKTPDEIAKSEQRQVEQAIDLIHKGRPAEALTQLEGVIAANELRHRDSGQDVYCARGTADTLMHMMQSVAAKRDAVAVDSTWCDAIFLKGFALVDLARPAEAREWIEKAIAMAPHNADYRNELAEGYKAERNWDKAFAMFEQAAEDARTFSPDNLKKAELSRALRGMGFVRIETGQLDQAEGYLKECLKLDPHDAIARNDLQLIAEQRARRTPN